LPSRVLPNLKCEFFLKAKEKEAGSKYIVEASLSHFEKSCIPK
jgi:hypothetical protein